MKLALIAAVADNGVIGKGNDIPWHLPDDLKYFSQVTKGNIVIMGRKTWESIPEKFRPLPDRLNIVVRSSPSKEVKALGTVWCKSISEAITIAKTTGKQCSHIFFMGGHGIYEESIDLCDELYLTRVHLEPEGDVFFPDWNTHDWELKSYIAREAESGPKYDFEIYQRKERKGNDE